MTGTGLDWRERLRQRLVELLVLAALVFIVARIVAARHDGAQALAREADVLEVLRAVHDAQFRAAESGDPARWLSELVDAAAPSSLLGALSPRSNAAGVELFELDGTLVALLVVDPGRPDDRAWSRAQATSDAGSRGYAAFAWPARFGPGHQWAFFVDHRGKLLGSWNHAGLLDGTNEPFPPNAHPLRDYLSARKEGDDSEWVLFDDLEEIFPAAADDQE